MPTMDKACATGHLLVRYGVMGEVARFAADGELPSAGTPVVVETARGPQIGTVIAESKPAGEETVSRLVLRTATEEDLAEAARLREVCEMAFAAWQERIRDWDVDVQLIDMEQTLEGGKQILYVLNDRGPETTKLALRAAAGGFGVIEVQPVGLEGVIEASGGGGGCGNCGHR